MKSIYTITKLNPDIKSASFAKLAPMKFLAEAGESQFLPNPPKLFRLVTDWEK